MRLLRIGVQMSVVVALGVGTLAGCSSGGGGGSAASFCDLVKKANNDKSLNSSGAQTKDQLAKINKLYDQLVSAAPGEIKADVKILADASKKFTQGDTSFATDQKKLEQIQTASAHLTTYSKDKCKVDLTSGT